MGYLPNSYTLDTSYMVLLPDSRLVREHPNDPDRWEWHFEMGEHDSTASVVESLSHAFGGWFADPAHHRIVRIDRTVLDEGDPGDAIT